MFTDYAPEKTQTNLKKRVSRYREGAFVDGAKLAAPFDDEVDFVVVGSGAAGAVAAYRLATHGWKVAMIEEGPWYDTEDFVPRVGPSFTNLLRDQGLQVAEGRSFIPLIQGRAVGGSTVVNSAIVWRLPEDVIDDWSERFGLAPVVGKHALDPHYEALERELSVTPTEREIEGTINTLFHEAAHALGIATRPMDRYTKGCQGSANCMQGCPHGAKQGMQRSYVLWTLEAGGRLIASVAVDRVEIRGGRAVAIHGTSASGVPVIVRARRGVLLAASTIQSPAILRRSGLRNVHLGKHFQAHPGHGVAGNFDRPIGMNNAATQGAESIHFRKTHRFKLETLSMPPELVSARVPGVGAALGGRLAAVGNLAVWVVQVRTHAEGEVGTTLFGRERTTFTPTQKDMETTRFATATIAKMLFEAGAKEVWPGVHGVPSVLTSPDQVKLLEEGPTDPRSYGFILSHLFGAARMAPDPRAGVVDLNFQVHGVDGLHVVDSSIFPTNLGINPQHGIMALSRLAADRITRLHRH